MHYTKHKNLITTLILSVFAFAQLASLVPAHAEDTILHAIAIGGTTKRLELVAPTKAAVDEDVSITLRAIAEDGTVDRDYKGTVVFSVIGDPNASFPLKNSADGYTFTGQDQGEHVFSKAFRFSKAGTVTVAAEDINDLTLKATTPITVSGSGKNSQIEILTPQKDSILTSKDVLMSGSAPAGSKVEIHESSNNVLLGEGTTDTTGGFSLEVKSLSEGAHTIKAKALDSDGTVIGESQDVAFTVRTTEPQAKEIRFLPSSQVPPKTEVTVEVDADANLSRVRLTFLEDSVALTQLTDKPGTYRGTFTAPADEGEYDVRIRLEDSFGNTGVKLLEKALNVKGKKITLTKKIFTIDRDGADMTVAWEYTGDVEEIEQYEIRYGLDELSLSESVKASRNSKTQLLSKLEATKPYFVTLILLDKNGLELTRTEVRKVLPVTRIDGFVVKQGSQASVIASWKKVEVPQVASLRIFYGKDPQVLVDSASIDSLTAVEAELKNLDQAGYTFQLVGFDSSANIIAKSIKQTLEVKKRDAFFDLAGVGSTGRVTLSWSDLGDSNIDTYMILFGKTASNRSEKVKTKKHSEITKSGKTSWYVPDLIDGLTYDFEVLALDATGKELYRSKVVAARAGEPGAFYAGVGGDEACDDFQVTQVRVSASGKTRHLTWKGVSGVSAYRVVQATLGGTAVHTWDVQGVSLPLPAYLGSDDEYIFTVRSKCPDGTGISRVASQPVRVATGPEVIILLLLSFGAGWYVWKKRQIAMAK